MSRGGQRNLTQSYINFSNTGSLYLLSAKLNSLWEYCLSGILILPFSQHPGTGSSDQRKLQHSSGFLSIVYSCRQQIFVEQLASLDALVFCSNILPLLVQFSPLPVCCIPPFPPYFLKCLLFILGFKLLLLTGSFSSVRSFA